MQFISSKVEIRYLPDDMDCAFILSDGGHFPIRRTDRNENCRAKRENQPAIDYSRIGGRIMTPLVYYDLSFDPFDKQSVREKDRFLSADLKERTSRRQVFCPAMLCRWAEPEPAIIFFIMIHATFSNVIYECRVLTDPFSDTITTEHRTRVK